MEASVFKSSGCQNCTRRNGRSFCTLGTSTLAQLSAIATPFRCGQGFSIFREGQSGNSVFILCSGRAKLFVVRTANPKPGFFV